MYLHVDYYLKVRYEGCISDDKTLERSFNEDYEFFLSEYSMVEKMRKFIPKILLFLVNQCIFRFGREIYRTFKKDNKVSSDLPNYCVKMQTQILAKPEEVMTALTDPTSRLKWDYNLTSAKLHDGYLELEYGIIPKMRISYEFHNTP
jgi:hypothetical protein